MSELKGRLVLVAVEPGSTALGVTIMTEEGDQPGRYVDLPLRESEVYFDRIRILDLMQLLDLIMTAKDVTVVMAAEKDGKPNYADRIDFTTVATV